VLPLRILETLKIKTRKLLDNFMQEHILPSYVKKRRWDNIDAFLKRFPFKISAAAR